MQKPDFSEGGIVHPYEFVVLECLNFFLATQKVTVNSAIQFHQRLQLWMFCITTAIAIRQ